MKESVSIKSNICLISPTLGCKKPYICNLFILNLQKLGQLVYQLTSTFCSDLKQKI